jgi:hypothetical protein
VGNSSVELVLGAKHHYVHGALWLFGRLRDAQGRLVEDEVGTGCQAMNESAVADIAVDDLQTTAASRTVQVGDPSAGEVVQNHHRGGPTGECLVGDVRSHEAGAARDEDPNPVQILAYHTRE